MKAPQSLHLLGPLRRSTHRHRFLDLRHDWTRYHIQLLDVHLHNERREDVRESPTLRGCELIRRPRTPLQWHPLFLLPLVAFPVAATIVQATVVMNLGAVTLEDGLQCDANDPLWCAAPVSAQVA